MKVASEKTGHSSELKQYCSNGEICDNCQQPTIRKDLFSQTSSSINWDTINEGPPLGTYNVVDFFSGCGGMSFGFYEAGKRTGIYRIAGAFDIDSNANATYFRNIGVEPHNLDLSHSPVKQIRKLLGKRVLTDPDRLIVIGCAPCQGFSSLRRGNRVDDIRNDLVIKFAEIVVALNPKIIVLENVRGIFERRNHYYIDALRARLLEGNYNIAGDVLNMASYGVPQDRKRAVILAARDIFPTLPPTILERESFRTVRGVIGSLPPITSDTNQDPMHVASKHREETLNVIRKIPKNGGSRPHGVGPACLDRVSGFADVYGRLSWDLPAVTITARCRTPSCGRFTHPDQDRGLSIREAALIQSFPSDYMFEGPFDNKYRQVGNAVPPIFSLQLAVHIITLLRRESYPA